MKVVFVEEVEGTANVGEIKDVKNGFARNYLLPRGLAVAATKHNLQRAEKLAKADIIRQEKLDGNAQVVAKKIDGAAISLTARVGQQGRLFGSVGAIDIARELNEQSGTDVDHRQVLLPQAIRTLGTQEVRIRLTRNVFAAVSVTVESEDGEGELTIAEAVEAVEAEEAAQSDGEAVEAETSTDEVGAAEIESD
jgi:large subunit ribosomal protein L9